MITRLILDDTFYTDFYKEEVPSKTIDYLVGLATNGIIKNNVTINTFSNGDMVARYYSDSDVLYFVVSCIYDGTKYNITKERV